ncbi:IpaD/SipD/SspD family type III secretion system needle tip protein [Yersinia enterocolitica]|uniref:IpaD/SipD/SspD family type III secretion system needle tip protein n=1 Tax=Yersinia enterocolitica TaxID=630 RepID=UPI001C8D33F9|nr:IpaD/SipD/SspD family type III secretion system needle tip protein [Yersinia enterocolitica]MBX9488621.1 IpaD/SipD/SspD family type III secretion system needle tip protein [Yersinia enterocolitica]MBX9492370.1 IpaD/SipD/SspD family type III secretion system needle tip protein [Yersinia enterocolitica]
MLIVNNAVPNTVSYYPSDTNATQSASMTETHAGLTSELNAKLIKELIAQLDILNKADKFDAIRATLGQYGLDSGGEDFKNSRLFSALERIKTANDGAQLSDDVVEMLANQEQRVKSTAQALSDIQREIVTDRTKANYSFSQFWAEKQRAAQESVSESKSSDDEISTHTSYAELWARMALAIKEIKGDYVDFYADLMQKYTEMYEAYNTHVQGAASKACTTGDDGNNVKFDTPVMQKGYDDFRCEISGIDLGSVKYWDIMTPEERKRMETTLAPAFKVNDSGKIEFNLDQYSAAPNYPSGISGGKVSTTSYHVWLASFNAGGSALQSNMQAFAQRYSQANSTFDNLNKVFSGAIASLAESAKDVFKALG